MNPFTTLTSRVVPLPVDSIDTDQIIPARFLKVTNKDGLGDGLFADWMADPSFVLNRKESLGARVLVAGENFGCGSSREHAPWALRAWGFRAIIALSFADVFCNNALKNGLVPVAVPRDFRDEVLDARAAVPGVSVTVNVAASTVQLGAGRLVTFALDPFARHCLLHGIDELGYLLGLAERIAAYEAGRA
ncbi:MAG: 3-isopropylmalate dehydratase small subunit [Polyangiaceae bacterium]|nr:3-isopropylmalate dehydratase small subunit [Polyangiaceae bacterium]